MATRRKSAKAKAKTARVEVIGKKKAQSQPGSNVKAHGSIEPAKGKLGVMIPGMGAVAIRGGR